MKRLITQLALLIAVLCASIPAHAYDCVVDGIYYNLYSSDNSAEVTAGDKRYKGSITIPEQITYEGSSYSVTSIGNCAFIRCYGLTSVTIPNSVTSIGERAFQECDGLTSIIIPNSVTSIDFYAFRYCGIRSVTFNAEKCTFMGESNNYYGPVFEGCRNLSSINIGSKVTMIPNGAFYGCSGLTSVTIPNSVTSIGVDAFCGCSGLTSVTIPNSVTSIGDWAFQGCSGLTSMTIPDKVTWIGIEAFSGCRGLKTLTCLAPNPPECGNSAVTGINKSKCTLYVLKESVNLYKAADQWKNFYKVRNTR